MNKKLKIWEVDFTAHAMGADAVINGDDMLVRFYDRITGAFLWIAVLC